MDARSGEVWRGVVGIELYRLPGTTTEHPLQAIRWCLERAEQFLSHAERDGGGRAATHCCHSREFPARRWKCCGAGGVAKLCWRTRGDRALENVIRHQRRSHFARRKKNQRRRGIACSKTRSPLTFASDAALAEIRPWDPQYQSTFGREPIHTPVRVSSLEFRFRCLQRRE